MTPTPRPPGGPDPRTTVVVITHNRRDDLLHTLGRLAELPERPPVTVVDNASRDGTAAAVRACHPWVRLLTPGRNLGALGRNLAARYVTTPYLAFCDDDSWWEPGSLAGAADLLDAHERLVSVTARIVAHPHPDSPGAWARHRGRPYEDPVVAELRRSPLPAPRWLPGPALGSFLAAATVLRTDAFRAAGGFSPRLVLGGEEELLAADLAAEGWWLVYADHLTAHHRASPHRDATLRRRHGIRNTLWFTWLRRPVPTALRRTALLVAAVPKDLVSVRAFADAARGLPWVLRERRTLPPEVEARLRLLEYSQVHSRARRYVG
ncbi:glycosyltransferase family 2 protein [Streptomyces pactum]|uniref:Glycosyltransferase family 2 protein n=1 Tax=Streptomyces pactum TaxID=68249 RepID=A0ABS0NU08_9ACTN|nr:glycosyltransferase [Streptomyces pactum]MBH5338675.1 glycosyltransferase family 2 protein [Streptomyces pactum]